MQKLLLICEMRKRGGHVFLFHFVQLQFCKAVAMLTMDLERFFSRVLQRISYFPT